jgi:hypothetical protein
MDRLKLETVYLRALDALMSADEYQIQAAIFRLRRAQARLHGWEVQRSQLSTHPRGKPPSRFTSHRTLGVRLRQPRGLFALVCRPRGLTFMIQTSLLRMASAPMLACARRLLACALRR